MPASGEYTRTDILFRVALNGIVPTDWFAPVDTVVPAHSSAVGRLHHPRHHVDAARGVVHHVESSAPPKPVSV